MQSRYLLPFLAIALILAGSDCKSEDIPTNPGQFSASIEDPSTDRCVLPGASVRFEAEVVAGTAESEFLWTVSGNATIENPTDKLAGNITFPDIGDYVVVLQAKGRAGDSLTEVGRRTINVRDSCEVTITATSPPGHTDYNVGEVISFTATQTGAESPFEVTWNFDDGSDVTLDPDELDTTHAYTQAGEYVFSVTIQDASNRTDWSSSTILVIAGALEIQIEEPANDGFVTMDQETTFTVNVIGGCPPYSVNWKFGDGNETTINLDQPGLSSVTHTYGAPAEADGRTDVKVIVTDAKGTEVQNSIRIFVTDGDEGIDSNVDGPCYFAKLPDSFLGSSSANGSVLVAGNDGVGRFDFGTEGWSDRILDGVNPNGLVALSNDCGTCVQKRQVEVVATFNNTGLDLHTWNGKSFDTAQLTASWGYDVSPYDSDPSSHGFIAVYGPSVAKYEVNPTSGVVELGDFWNSNSFPDRTGGLRSAVARSNGAFLLISDGRPSQLYTHDGGVSSDGVKVADVGEGGRKVRAIGEVFAITSQFDDNIVVGLWSALDIATITATVDVGGATNEIDMKVLPNGNMGILTTPEGNVVVTEIDTGGNFVNNTTVAFPGRCSGSLGAVWYPDDSTRVLIPCASAQAMFVVETGL